MGKRHFRPEELLEQLLPQDLGFQYLSLRRLEFRNKTIQIFSGSEEVCLVCIDGEISFVFQGQKGIMEMNDVIYLPRESKIALSSYEGTLVRFGAPCSRDTEFAFISFFDIHNSGRHRVYGSIENGTKRDVWHMVDNSIDSPRLLLGICKGSPGSWTSLPPHSRGGDREECYVYFDMKDSFGAQFVYDHNNEPSSVALVRDGDAVAIPRGYHPNCGCPQGGISFVYCMAFLKEEQREFSFLQVEPKYCAEIS